MDRELKQVAVKQYLRYFRVWFIILGIAFLICAVAGVRHLSKERPGRDNESAPDERVFDYADVLSAKEEEKLRELIAETEEKIRCDIVLVTIKEPVGVSDYEWEYTMRNIADDFYDENHYGYDKVHGDGVLLLDNWYEGQKGSWLSTCGRAVDEMSKSKEQKVLRAVAQKADADPFQAYRAYVEEIAVQLDQSIPFPVFLVILPLVVMLIFVAVKMRSSVGKDTVAVTTYVAGGQPEFREKSDQLINTFITKRYIPKPSSSGSGSGGGGVHRSSGGVRHGGGGMRR